MGELRSMIFEQKKVINGQVRGVYRCPWCKTAYIDSFFDDIDGEIFNCIDCDLQLKNPRYLEFNLDFSL